MPKVRDEALVAGTVSSRIEKIGEGQCLECGSTYFRVGIWSDATYTILCANCKRLWGEPKQEIQPFGVPAGLHAGLHAQEAEGEA